MKIQLKSQLKPGTKSLYIIFADERAIGLLPKKALSFFYELEIGKACFDESSYQQLLSEIKHYAKLRLFSYLAKAEKSVFDCQMFLKRLFIDEDIAYELIEEAEKLNFVNDERFSGLFCESCYIKGFSKKETIFKLKQKKINHALIDEAISKFYNYDENIKQIKKAVEKAKRLYEGSKNSRQKTINYLLRKGFSWDEIENFVPYAEF